MSSPMVKMVSAIDDQAFLATSAPIINEACLISLLQHEAVDWSPLSGPETKVQLCRCAEWLRESLSHFLHSLLVDLVRILWRRCRHGLLHFLDGNIPEELVL